MTSVQLRYSGSLTGLDWLVEDLKDVGLDPRFPPPDRIEPETSSAASAAKAVELVLDLRHTGDEGRLQAISDPGGLEVIDHAIASFNDRFESVASAPVVTIVGVQSNPSTAAAVVLKNPDLAFCTDIECACAEDDLICPQANPALSPAAVMPTGHTVQPRQPTVPQRSLPLPVVRRKVSRFLARLNGNPT